MKLRLSLQTRKVLQTFVQEPGDWKYGYDISRSTALNSGTLYPILMRLADRKLLETSWETAETGLPQHRDTPVSTFSRRISKNSVLVAGRRRGNIQTSEPALVGALQKTVDSRRLQKL